MLQQCGVKTTEMEQGGQDESCLAVPVAASQSAHSDAMSSTQEVEDCEDLEVVGIDSGTNIVGMSWTDKAGVVNGVAAGESFTKIKGLQQTPNPRDGSFDDSESDDGDSAADGGQIIFSIIKPASSTSNQNLSQTVESKESTSRIESPGIRDDHIDDVDDSGRNMNQPALNTAHQTSTHKEELREIPGHCGKPKIHDDIDADNSDFDDDDDDDDVHEPTDVALRQDNIVVADDNKLVAATLATPVAAEPERSQVHRNASDEDADDNDDDHTVSDPHTKNGMAVAFTGTTSYFDKVFTKNLDSEPQMQKTEDIDTEIDNSRRAKLSRQYCEVEELEQRSTDSQDTVNIELDGMRNRSQVLQPLQEGNNGSESEEDIGAIGNVAATGVKNELSVFKLLGESQLSYDKAKSSRTENEVRLSTTVRLDEYVYTAYGKTILCM